MSKNQKHRKKKGEIISNEPKVNNQNIFDIITKSPIPYLIIIILGFLVNFQTIFFEFSGLDDKDYLVPRAVSVGGISHLKEEILSDAFFKAKGTDFYRPVQNISYVIDTDISGYKPWGYHLSNIIIHIFTCLSLLFLLFTLKFNRFLSLLVTALFTVHPLFTHAVAWIPSRGDLLIGLFGILSFVFFLKYLNTKKIIFLIFHSITLLLAVCSKESAIGLPVIFLFWIVVIEKNKIITILNPRNLTLIITWLIVPGFYLYLRSLVMVSSPSAKIFGIKPFLSNLAAIPEFLSKFIFPFKLSPMPQFDIIVTGIGIVLILFIFILFLLKNIDKRFLLFNIVWFLVFSIPSMFYRHETAETAYDYLEHRAYLPLVGIIIIVLYIIDRNIKKSNYNKILYIIIPMILISSIYTFIYAQNYKNPISFYNKVINSGSRVALAYMNRGKVKHDNGDKKGALIDYNDAILINPEYPIAFNNRGLLKTEMGDRKGAIEDYDNAIRLKPDFSEALSNRGNTKSDMGDLDGAMKDLNLSIKYNPENYKAFNTRAVVKAMKNDFKTALTDINIALNFNPNYYESYANRGNIRHALGDIQGACADWQILASRGDKYAQKMIEKVCKKK